MAPMRVALADKRTSHLFDNETKACYVSHMWTQSCGEAASLLVTYWIALSAYRQSQQPLIEVTTPGDPALIGIVTAKEEALLNFVSAKEAYWGHVEGHGCRQQLIELPQGGLS